MSENRDPRIKLIERLRLQLEGHVYVGNKMKEGWKEPIPHYIFMCPIHGLVEDYPHGYQQRLECPLCKQSAKKERPKAKI